jgi:COMPASS component SPP1
MPRSQAAPLLSSPSDTDSDGEQEAQGDAAEAGEELHCLCRQPWRATDSSMIACDDCDVWYHTVCVGVSPEEFLQMKDDSRYTCPTCRAAQEE